MPWNPEQYHKFTAEREQPFQDLLQLLTIRPKLDVIDLGCGTGRLTAQLQQVLPDSQVLGIDSSPEMMAQTVPGYHLRFNLSDIRSIQGNWDVIFSNAALQWLPNHSTLIPHLFTLLKPQGQLVIQIPSNRDHIAYRLIYDIAKEAPFCNYLHGFIFELTALGISEYAELLFKCGGINITVMEKVYPCLLSDYKDIIEWVKGTVLTPYLERLAVTQQEEFLETYDSRLHAALPHRPIFFGFRRILLSVTKP